MKRRAFSLVEILLVMFLMGLMGGMGLFAFRGATSRGEAQGVADLVAEELRGVRQRAISQHVPVAVVLPSAGGTLGQARSLYVLEGETKPHVTRRVTYAREHPNSQIFVGLWPVTGPVGRDDIQTGAGGQEFAVKDWNPPVASDYVLMFTPAGSVKTNGLPHFDGHYHLVVSQGLVAGPGTAPPGSGVTTVNYFGLSEVGLPSTISISPAGFITVQKGVTGLTSGVAVRDYVIPGGPGGSSPPLWVAGGNRDPVVSSAGLDPQRTAPFRIAPNEHASIVLEATDPDGDPLYVNWTTVPANTGKFSLSTQSKMDWVPDGVGTSHWRGCWVWTPPEGWPPGSTCRLHYDVSDGQGGLASGDVAGDLTSVAPSRIAFMRQMPGPGAIREIVTCSRDGTGEQYASVEGDSYDHGQCSFSPNGQWLASFGHTPSGWWNLFVGHTDGSELTQIFTGPLPASTPFIDGSFPLSWSRDGSQLVFESVGFVNGAIFRVNGDGTNVVQLSTPPVGSLSGSAFWDFGGVCSPRPVAGSEKVAFWRQEYTMAGATLNTVYTVNLAGGAETLISDLGNGKDPSWSPDGSKIVYSGTDGVWLAASDGSSKALLINTASTPYKPIFSPDGTKILFGMSVVTSTGSDVDTGAANSPKVLSSNWNGGYRSWSPGSDEILYTDPTRRLHIVNVSGTPVDRVLPALTNLAEPFPRWWGP